MYGNSRDIRARRLADWWEKHQKDDEERKRRELAAVVEKEETHCRYVIQTAPETYAKFHTGKTWDKFSTVDTMRGATPLSLDMARHAIKYVSGPGACIVKLTIRVKAELAE